MRVMSVRSARRRVAAAALTFLLAAGAWAVPADTAVAHDDHARTPGGKPIGNDSQSEAAPAPIAPLGSTVTPSVGDEPVFDRWFYVADGEYRQPFSVTVTATAPSSAGAITYSIIGQLPKGLELDSDTGVISGLPEESINVWFAVKATNNDGSNSVWVYLRIAGRPLIYDENIDVPSGLPGEPYSGSVVAIGGAAAGPITYTVTHGTLPAGLTLDPATGAITGTPTEARKARISITAVNEAGEDTVWVDIDIYGYPIWDESVIENYDLAEVRAGETVDTRVSAQSPFGQTITYSAPRGLPAGLSLDANTGDITGIPLNGGRLRVVIRASNALGYAEHEWIIAVERLADTRTADSIVAPSVSEQVSNAAPVSAAAPATSTQGLTVSYEVRRPSVCTYNGSTITIVGPGRCVIEFYTAGDASYRPALAFVNFNVTPAVPQKGGPVVLGGDDAPDHGDAYPPAFDAGEVGDRATVFNDGWRYVMLAVRAVYENSYRPGNDGSVAILGSADPGSGYMESEYDTGALIKMLGDRFGFTVNFYPSPTDIGNFFTALAANSAKPAMIYVAGEGSDNDFGDNDVEGADLAPFADDIAEFVNSGGALLSHGADHYPDWLGTVFPGLDMSFQNDNDIINLTPDGNILFPGLVDADLESPWHGHFVGDLKFLKVLGWGSEAYLNEEGNRQQVLIGGIRAVFPAGLIGEGPEDAVERTAAASVSATLTVNGSPVSGVTITFTVSSGPNAGWSQTAVTNANGVATVSLTYPVSGVGDEDEVDISVTYNSVDYTDRVTVQWEPVSQSIDFDPPTTAFVGEEITPDGTASSGLPVTYTASGKCVIIDGVAKMTGRGQCVLTAYQVGGGSVPPATPVVRIITVSPRPVTVKWEGFTLTPLPGNEVELFMRATTAPFVAGCTVVFTLTPDLGSPNGPYEATTYTTAGAKAGPIRMVPGLYDIDLQATGDCEGQGAPDLQIEVPGSLPDSGFDPVPAVVVALALLAVGGVFTRRRRFS